MEVKEKKYLYLVLGSVESELERFWKDRERKSYCMMEIRSLWRKSKTAVRCRQQRKDHNW